MLRTSDASRHILAAKFQAAHYNGLFHRVEGLVSDWKREDEEGHDVKDCWWLPWWLFCVPKRWLISQTGATLFL